MKIIKVQQTPRIEETEDWRQKEKSLLALQKTIDKKDGQFESRLYWERMRAKGTDLPKVLERQKIAKKLHKEKMKTLRDKLKTYA